MPPIIRMKGVSKSFTGVAALDGVDLTLRAGEVHALMGENGAGKSTLVKALTGVHRPDSGTVELDGRPVSFHHPREAQEAGIATVYQEVNLTENLTVAENLFAGREPRLGPFIRFRAMRKRAEEALARVGLDLDVTAPLSTLSIAVQQLVAIARAVDMDAKVLVLDEPTSSLDQDEVRRLLDTMRRLADDGTALVFISHFLDQVYDVCDRMTVLRNGTLVGEWPTADLPEADLIGRMLGRESTSLAGLEERRREREPRDEVLLSATALGRKGAVEPFTVDLRRGEVLGLAGLLGSGRTETARLLAGADPADAGTLAVDGRTRRGHNPRNAIAAGIAYCSENRKTEGLLPDLTVAENITVALQASLGWARPIPAEKRRTVVADLVERLDIRPADPDMPVRNLSGGNQQKVLLARWLLTEPRLLILDEPTRGIDIGAKADIQNLVAELSGQGMSVVFISAELDEVVRLSDRIGVLKDRRMIDILDNTPQTTASTIVDTIAGGARP
ncbi:sugar ABC transporter ATP-binding protein [Salininema proteolyticum]|uniref:Sugar ABC transporter ATP-binding protein n=1 Tax=Salininema proteolyticum TaxID=1607685 RepID=A0ABV8TYB3_9ACTN